MGRFFPDGALIIFIKTVRVLVVDQTLIRRDKVKNRQSQPQFNEKEDSNICFLSEQSTWHPSHYLGFNNKVGLRRVSC